ERALRILPERGRDRLRLARRGLARNQARSREPSDARPGPGLRRASNGRAAQPRAARALVGPRARAECAPSLTLSSGLTCDTTARSAERAGPRLDRAASRAGANARISGCRRRKKPAKGRRASLPARAHRTET